MVIESLAMRFLSVRHSILPYQSLEIPPPNGRPVSGGFARGVIKTTAPPTIVSSG